MSELVSQCMLVSRRQQRCFEYRAEVSNPIPFFVEDENSQMFDEGCDRLLHKAIVL